MEEWTVNAKISTSCQAKGQESTRITPTKTPKEEGVETGLIMYSD